MWMKTAVLSVGAAPVYGLRRNELHIVWDGWLVSTDGRRRPRPSPRQHGGRVYREGLCRA